MTVIEAATEVLVRRGYANALEIANEIDVELKFQPIPGEQVIVAAVLKHIVTLTNIPTTWEAVKSKTRKREICYARHLIAYFLRKHLAWSLVQIGQFIGNRDHSTIINSTEEVEALVAVYKPFKKVFNIIDSELNDRLR